MRKNVVILTSDLYRGGVAYSASVLYNAFKSSQEFNVSILTYENLPILTLDEDDNYIQTLNCYYSRTSYKSLLKQFFVKILRYPGVFLASYRLSKFCKKNSTDIIIALTLAPAISACIVKYFNKKVKVIVSERQDPGLDLKSDLLKYFVLFTYKYSDKVHVNSLGLEDVLKNEFGINEKKIFVSPNVLKSKIPNYNETYKFAKSETINAIYAGRLSDQKALYLLPYIISIFKELGYNINLDIYGNGEDIYINEIKELSSHLGVSYAIKFKGFTNDIDNYIKQYDIGVFTSNWESFGNSLAEFLSAPMPVIASRTRCGLVNYLIDEGDVLLLDTISKDEVGQKYDYLKSQISNFVDRDFGKEPYWKNTLNNFTSENQYMQFKTALQELL